MENERESAKYQKALALAVDLEEKTPTPYSKISQEYLKKMEPENLYEFLVVAWWRKWDATHNEWQRRGI